MLDLLLRVTRQVDVAPVDAVDPTRLVERLLREDRRQLIAETALGGPRQVGAGEQLGVPVGDDEPQAADNGVGGKNVVLRHHLQDGHALAVARDALAEPLDQLAEPGHQPADLLHLPGDRCAMTEEGDAREGLLVLHDSRSRLALRRSRQQSPGVGGLVEPGLADEVLVATRPVRFRVEKRHRRVAHGDQLVADIAADQPAFVDLGVPDRDQEHDEVGGSLIVGSLAIGAVLGELPVGSLERGRSLFDRGVAGVLLFVLLRQVPEDPLALEGRVQRRHAEEAPAVVVGDVRHGGDDLRDLLRHRHPGFGELIVRHAQRQPTALIRAAQPHLPPGFIGVGRLRVAQVEDGAVVSEEKRLRGRHATGAAVELGDVRVELGGQRRDVDVTIPDL